MAGVPAARWWVEEPLDHTWHDAHPQVLLAGEGHSLGKELRHGTTAWQKPRTACAGKAIGKGPWRGGSQPRTQGHRKARELSRAETQWLLGTTPRVSVQTHAFQRTFFPLRSGGKQAREAL